MKNKKVCSLDLLLSLSVVEIIKILSEYKILDISCTLQGPL
jgi:hypothetical protein